eukprot:g11568.t1
MGNLFGKDCPDPKKQPKQRPGGVGWKAPGGERGSAPSKSLGGGQRGKLNPRDFTFTGKQKEVLVREPGGIGGQQFIVEECSECEVFLLDHTAALTIDVCTDCRIFTGPCESSLAGQFAAAKLSVWNNKWSQVYNFTGGGDGDWSCLPHGAHHRDFTANSLPDAARQRVGYTDNTHGAVVPITAGMRGFEATEETCFMVVMPGHIDAVLGKLLAVGGGGGKGAAGSPAGTSRLLRTKLFRPQPAQSKPFFADAPSIMAELASSSPVLGMQWAGSGSTEAAVSLLAAAGISVPASPLTPLPPPPSGPDTGKKSKKKKKKGNADAVADGAGGDRAEAWVGTADYYMAAGGDGGGGGSSNEASAAKAKIFFELWEEDKSMPIVGS